MKRRTKAIIQVGITTLILSALAIAAPIGINVADENAYKKNYEKRPTTEQVLFDTFATYPSAEYHDVIRATFPKKDVCVYAVQSLDKIYLTTYTYNLVGLFHYEWGFKGVNL